MGNACRHMRRFDQSLGNRIGQSGSSPWQRPLQTLFDGHRGRKSDSSQCRRGWNWSHLLLSICLESLKMSWPILLICNAKINYSEKQQFNTKVLKEILANIVSPFSCFCLNIDNILEYYILIFLQIY